MNHLTSMFVSGTTIGFIGGCVLSYFFWYIKYTIPKRSSTPTSELPSTLEECVESTGSTDDAPDELDMLYHVMATQADSIKILSTIIQKGTVCTKTEVVNVPQHDENDFPLEAADVNSLHPPAPEIRSLSTSESKVTFIEGSEDLSEMFLEEDARKSRTLEEVLDIGRSVGPEPVKYFSTPGSGYATMKTIEKAGNDFREFKNQKRLKRADELDILNAFVKFRGTNYFRAERELSHQGYGLHPIYINDGPKRPALTYRGDIIGVSVRDENYDSETNSLSHEAEIVNLIDVGGQDSRGIGCMKL
jgi:hypothetical protein